MSASVALDEALKSRSLASFLWYHRWQFRRGLFLSIMRVVALAPVPLIFRHIVDMSHASRADVSGILSYSLVVIVLLAIHYWFHNRGSQALGRATMRMIINLRSRIFDKIQYLSFGYLDRQRAGRLLSKYAFDTQKVDSTVFPLLSQFIPNVIYSLLIFIVMTVMNWRLAFLLVAMLPLLALMRSIYFKKVQTRHEENRAAEEALTGRAGEYLNALRLVRSYGQEEHVVGHLDRTNERVIAARIGLIDVSSRMGSFAFSAVQVMTLIVVSGGAIMATRGQMTAGDFVGFVSAVPTLVNPIQTFSQFSDQFFLGQAAYNSIQELIRTPYVENWHGEQKLPDLQGRIHFEGVSFLYPEVEKAALRDFSLEIAPGEKVALAGPSGAGKSTLASLLLGLYRPSSGTIRIDGVAQEDLDMRWFRQNVAIVMQESILLSGSVQDNIRFAREGATDEEVREAARLAHAEEFILRMPEGYETVVGERGAMLSGGQRQRLSIARALLRNPKILILDEPTSALDYESERLIQDALKVLSRNRTVLTIAHRLSTIRDSDRIIVLKDGMLAEQGKFDELVARGGYFSELLARSGMG